MFLSRIFEKYFIYVNILQPQFQETENLYEYNLKIYIS